MLSDLSSTIDASPADSPPSLTWAQAVEWLRRQPDQQELVRACYYDDPLLEAARRFAASDEWKALSIWRPTSPGEALDVGAGRGISSYALACDGWRVTALEPDDSPVVGSTAIRQLARDSGLPINVVCDRAESLPFGDGRFDLVYGRQVLHHTRDLPALCRELARVLRPGGRFIATREHVITIPQDLADFLEAHPLHRLYGGEHAYRIGEYTDAIHGAGLRLLRVLGPYDSVVNYFPMTYDQWCEQCRRPLTRRLGRGAARLVADERHALGRWILHRLAAHLSSVCNTPGRLYSFIAVNPPDVF